MEEDDDGRLTRSVPLYLRHYLRVNNLGHRVALAKVMLSGHKYGVEALRRGRAHVARSDRVCRLCTLKVETPEHVWLECGANEELRQLRNTFARDVLRLCTEREAQWLSQADGDVLMQMRRLVAVRSSVQALLHGWLNTHLK